MPPPPAANPNTPTTGPRKRSARFRIGSLAALFALGLYLNNASWLAPTPTAGSSPRWLAHRGVHLDFDRHGLGRDDCTATRIRPPWVKTLENTLESMSAAFAAGADVVEVDIHPTTDGHFAVFHDYTIDCRTNGSGRTRDHDLASLQALDIGYGYTADGGRTFPYRGKGVGLMPSLADVVSAFPTQRFLINIKSNDPGEGDLFAEALLQDPQLKRVTWGVYGGERPLARVLDRVPDVRGFSKNTLKACLIRYLLLGWTGHVPSSCHNAMLAIPSNYAPLLWGWPNRFMQRMDAAGTAVILRGPYAQDASEGIDRPSQLADIPAGFRGWVWTNRIEQWGGHPSADSRL